ncbi:hypothetical protein [Nibricoccus aquaticus]|uniref:hypothetical protein n=1 Tax=Nibricoccus aquaticus TaxID=2576891 RepID=UPI0010FD0E8D|nr:hypothetical protein [Nibricoccus aquaticus]
MTLKFSLRWIFNTRMLLGALIGCGLFASINSLRDAKYHSGPGYVTYGDGDRYPEREEWVSESKYKKHRTDYAWFGIIFCITAWLLAAHNARLEDAEAAKNRPDMS